MSIPRDLLDQLLTGYLDDALSVDERAQVEQLLETDGEVVEELAQLEQLRQSLKVIARADSDVKLDAGFADRVLDAAVARASAEGLAEDHPLFRLAEQPSTTTRTVAPRRYSWRVGAVLVALAASIAFALFALRPSTPPDPGFAIAEVEPETMPDPDAVPVPEEVRQDEIGTEVIANSQQVVEPESTSDENVSPVAPPLETIVETDVPEMETTETIDQNLVMGIGPIMVLHVERTEAGRQSRAVMEAMRLAALPSTSKKEITEAMAGVVSKTQEQADESTLLYLHAPGKNLDRFYLRLLSDEAGIQSIGISLATNVPVLKMVNALKADPTDVRHVGSSMELLSDEGVVQHIVNDLRQHEVAPMSRASKALIPGSVRNEGPDELSQVLVLIR